MIIQGQVTGPNRSLYMLDGRQKAHIEVLAMIMIENVLLKQKDMIEDMIRERWPSNERAQNTLAFQQMQP